MHEFFEINGVVNKEIKRFFTEKVKKNIKKMAKELHARYDMGGDHLRRDYIAEKDGHVVYRRFDRHIGDLVLEGYDLYEFQVLYNHKELGRFITIDDLETQWEEIKENYRLKKNTCKIIEGNEIFLFFIIKKEFEVPENLDTLTKKCNVFHCENHFPYVEYYTKGHIVCPECRNTWDSAKLGKKVIEKETGETGVVEQKGNCYQDSIGVRMESGSYKSLHAPDIIINS